MQITRFVNNFSWQPIETLEQQGAKLRNYLDSLEASILAHPLWKDATEDDQEGVSEGLEKYVITQLYKK